MRRLVGWLIAAAVVAAACFGVYRLVVTPESPESAKSPAAPGGPAAEETGGKGLLAAPGASEKGTVPPPAPIEDLLPPPDPVSSPAAGGGGAGLAVATFKTEADWADAALQRGDVGEAVRIWRSVFLRGKDEGGAGVIACAQKLLAHDADPEGRKEYLHFLLDRGEGQAAFEEQLALAQKLARSAESSEQKRAWDELALAYDAAARTVERERVLAVLNPYIQEMVFSGRFAPIVASHTVVTGDNLTGIARKFSTTVDALRRLNGLKSDVIQPRTRLRILPGKVKIFVDKSDFRLWLTVDDRVLLERPVGLGQENRTPVGIFEIDDRQKDPTWYRPGQPPLPPGHPENVLGTRWLGFKDTDEHTGFGIHGTANRSDLGRESSAGCIRLLTADIELIYDFVPLGTLVKIVD